MKIREAFRAVNDEYNHETILARDDKPFDALMKSIIHSEYEELDQELPSYVADILGALKFPEGPLDERIYIMARLVFRFGMRVQRKLDRPDEVTSMFWRSDQQAQ